MNNLEYAENLILGSFDDPYYDTFHDKYGANDAMSPWFHVKPNTEDSTINDLMEGGDDTSDDGGILADDISEGTASDDTYDDTSLDVGILADDISEGTASDNTSGDVGILADDMFEGSDEKPESNFDTNLQDLIEQ